MKDHKEYQCPKRQEKCEHCDYHNSHDIVMENHLPVCPESPVECPNKARKKISEESSLKRISMSVPCKLLSVLSAVQAVL